MAEEDQNHDVRLAVLKARTKGVAEEIRVLKHRTRKLDSYLTRNDKSRSGAIILQTRTHGAKQKARETHLAYGFLRGVPYHCIEPTRRPHNEPDAHYIAKAIPTVTLEIKTSDWERKIDEWIRDSDFWFAESGRESSSLPNTHAQVGGDIYAEGS